MINFNISKIIYFSIYTKSPSYFIRKKKNKEKTGKKNSFPVRFYRNEYTTFLSYTVATFQSLGEQKKEKKKEE